MIKECPVILNNSAVTVVQYDNVKIQFPSIQKKVKTVFVKYENGKYEIVEKTEPVMVTEEKEVFFKKPQRKLLKQEIQMDELVESENIPENNVVADAE